MPSFFELMGVPHTGFDPDHTFETSWLFKPLILAYVRLGIAIYCWITLFVGYFWDAIHLHHSSLISQRLSYFTELTFYGITLYFTISTIHTIVYASRGKAWLNSWPRFLQACHGLYYTTIVTLPFLVTVVFWALLYKGKWFKEEYDGWSNVSKHMLNSVFALFELVIPATNAPPWLHLVFVLLILLLYLGLAYLTHALHGWYPYTFLDPNQKGGRGMVAAYCAGICAAGIVIFVISRYLIWGRKRFTRAGKKSAADGYHPSPYVQQYDIEMAPKR